MFRRPGRCARVANVVPQQKHLELLPRAMLLLLHLVTGADQIPHRFILRLGHVDAGQLSRTKEPRQFDPHPADPSSRGRPAGAAPWTATR